jgi:PAS domain S-box-containing protein
MFGYAATEIVGRSIMTLIPPELYDEERDILARLRRGERIDHYETVRVAKDGRRVDVSLTVSPLRNGTGEIIGASKIARDITERRQAAAKLAEQRAEREQLLRNERIARSEAERANRVKDDFVAMVSHELRTPLNAILGWTELLHRRSGDPEILAHGLEVIARNTRLQAKLIADLLDVSRIVSGKLRLEMDEVDLGQAVRNSVEALHTEAEKKGVELAVRLDSEPIPLLGDPERLQQILWNLISNAIKFTPKGGTITVSSRTDPEQAEITVTDTGVGIRPEFLPEIFERFRQDSAMLTRRHGGLGLGLSITKHLVELHGGSIRERDAAGHPHPRGRGRPGHS